LEKRKLCGERRKIQLKEIAHEVDGPYTVTKPLWTLYCML